MEKLAVLHPDQATDRGRLERAFGKTLFIHLTRPDKVAQAVSYVKAQQTGLWHKAPDGTEIERLAPPAEPAYDSHAIGESYQQFLGFDRDWRTWFEDQGITPFEISYEALSDDPTAVLKSVLEQFGLNTGVAETVRLPVARLADATNADWCSRFRQSLETA